MAKAEIKYRNQERTVEKPSRGRHYGPRTKRTSDGGMKARVQTLRIPTRGRVAQCKAYRVKLC